MKIIKFTVLSFFLLLMGSFGSSSNVHASSCQLVDPVNGLITITCGEARLDVSTNGVRSLPHPNAVKLGTRLLIKWVQPFSGNTIVQSWDAENQMSHFWQYENGQWVNRPDDAYMQENGTRPAAHLQVRVMPNGNRGWAVIKMNNLMIWNGGN